MIRSTVLFRSIFIRRMGADRVPAAADSIRMLNHGPVRLDCSKRGPAMADDLRHEPARDPQELERLLVSRERAGDVDGMVALYEPQAVLDCGGGRLLHGTDSIREFFAEQVASGCKFDYGDQRPAIISGDLALTSTLLPDGSTTAEVARRQQDGTWRWVIDQFAIA